MYLKKPARLIITLLMLMPGVVSSLAQDNAPAYDAYVVLDVQELPLHSGPAQTSAHLSPDGTRFVHIHGSTYCFYALNDANTWVEEECIELEREISGGDPEEIYWSPDGQWLALPTYREAFIFLRDTEIRVLNTETFEVIVLTDDGEEGNMLDGDFTGYFDTTARWRDEDTLVFLRNGPDDDYQNTYLMQMSITDDQPKALSLLPAPARFSTYVLTVSDDGSEVAYNVNDYNSAPENGIWTMSLDSLEPAQVVAIEEQAGMPLNLDYSTDGNYLLNINARGMVYGTPATTVEVVELATGEIIPFDDSLIVIGAGWSPDGNALAYIARNPQKPENAGLYISPAPGAPGRLVLPGEFAPPTSTWRMPLVWADNDTILIGRGNVEGVLLVQLGIE